MDDLVPPGRGDDVLVVEDDGALREAVTHGLRKSGFRVRPVGTAAEALRQAHLLRPAAAVVDLLLPDAGGLGLVRALRSLRQLEGLPVLYVTGLGPRMVRDTLFPDPVLFKPFTYRQLVAAVRQLLRTGGPDAGFFSPPVFRSR